MVDQRLGKAFRVCRRRDISRIFAEGRRRADGLMTLLAVPNGLDRCRAVFGVSKAHGNAVRRNRVRRRCREAFRLSRSRLPAGWDFMIMPRPGRTLTRENLTRSLEKLVAKATRDPDA